MSQLETSLHFSSPLLLDYAINGVEPTRKGNRDPGAAPHGVYPCQGEDRWIAIACFREEEWQALRQVITSGGASWAEQDGLDSLLGRKTAEDQLDDAMAAWTRSWDAKTLMETLQQAGVPADVVNDSRDLFNDAQLHHRGHFQYLDHAEIGSYVTEKSEFNLSDTPGQLDRPAPMMGEHTAYVLKELVGLSEQEYQSFKADDVLE